MEKGKRMYENQFLLNVRMAVNSNTHFFNGRCKASMKKSISYIINVQVSSNGSIEACQCDCGVGEPPNAHCKHVVALLLAVEQLKRESKIILHTTCTQGLQSFHKPKCEYFGTPLRTVNLKKGNCNFTNSVNFKPVDPAALNVNKYRERVRNMCVNFIANSRSTMPFKHTIMPANTYAVALDHNYVIDPAEELLRSLKVSNVSDYDIYEIEMSTRDQSNCPKWHDLRRHHITASNFYSCNTVSNEAKINLVERILNPTIFKTKQTQRGKDCELIAIKQYESFGIKIDKCGFIIMKKNPCLGASPDGFIGNDTILEVKCPWNQRFSLINNETVPYLQIDGRGNLSLDPLHPYYFQIQGQMMVTNRKFANLLVFSFIEFIIINVIRNESFIADMEEKLMTFYNDYFKPALLKKYLYKNYAKCFFK